MSPLFISIETLTVFSTVAVALALAPGPDNIFVLTQSALHGRLAGLQTILGLCVGILCHTTAVALGVAAIFAASALAFTILKFAGAAYLIYLAWQAFRAGAAPMGQASGRRLPWYRLLTRGIIMNVTNPKVALFFLAFLPHYADPTRGSLALQIFVLGATFAVVTLLVFGLIAWFSGSLGELLRRSVRIQKCLHIIAGVVFAGLAARLILAER